MEISSEVKAILLMMAKQNSNCDGVYPTVSSHGDNHRELEEELKSNYEELLHEYKRSIEELEFI